MSSKKCEFCKKPLKKTQERFCSRGCLFNAMKVRKKITCEYCGEVFEREPHKQGKFCSHECYTSSRTGQKRKATGFYKYCKECSQKFYVTKSTSHRIFCSRKCYNLNKRKEHRVKKECPVCKKFFYTNNPKRKNCSKKCQHMAIKEKNNPIHNPETRKKHKENTIKAMQKIKHKISGENHPNWQGGISFGKYCQKFNEEFKERCREFWGRKCGLCGKTEEKDERKLGVHHVNYDKETCCNTTKPLFIPLCKSCHMKTNHHRQSWEKMLTNYIMIYFNGECYNEKK